MAAPQNNFILAVPGSDQTRELSRDGLMQELVMGKITADHWVWSPEDSDWKQISELPALRAPVPPPTPAPIPKLTVCAAPISKVTVNPAPIAKADPAPIGKITVNPAPIPRTAAAASGVPKLTVNPAPISKSAVAPVEAPPIMPLLTPKANAAPAPRSIPALAPLPPAREIPSYTAAWPQPISKAASPKASPAKVKKKQFVQTKRNVKVEEDEGVSYVKLLFGALYVAVAAVIAANYLLVDKKFDETLAHTPFVLVPTHAHLGSFVQPNALVIHILPNDELTDKNLADYLQTLAQITPDQPFKDAPFSMVALSSAWFSEYALSGEDWKELGKMKDAGTQDREDFIADHLCTIAGQPLIRHSATLGISDLKTARSHVWADLSAHFAGGHS